MRDSDMSEQQIDHIRSELLYWAETVQYGTAQETIDGLSGIIDYIQREILGMSNADIDDPIPPDHDEAIDRAASEALERSWQYGSD